MVKAHKMNVLKVVVIKKKILQQIVHVPYETKIYRQLEADLMAERAVVRFWVPADQCGKTESRQRLWLIEHTDGSFNLMLPPNTKDHEGNPVELWEKYKDVPQLFVD